MSELGWGLIGLFVLLIVIAGEVSGVLRALAGISGDLSSIREEIQGLRHDLCRERHPKHETDPF